MLIDELKQLHGLTSYSVLKKNSNMFQYNDKDYIKLLKIDRFIQMYACKSPTEKQEHLIRRLLNLNKVPRIVYPPFFQVDNDGLQYELQIEL